MSELQLINMSDVEATAVQWLWYPYIPFGKLTIMQGDPGEGKTHLILAIAALLTNGKALPGAEATPPANVIYQTAEDGLSDTIKPRLELVGADCNRILVIDESKEMLSLSDERIREAIQKTDAKLIILDPLQAYLGANVDMHRANEIRPVFHKLGQVAEETSCAVVIIGHMNKGGTKSGYRGLGSIDITAAARSVLVVGKSPQDPNIRIMAHSKSNLAPAGKSIAFELGNAFRFLGTSSITVDELLGFEPVRRNVLEEAKALIVTMLSHGKQESRLISQAAQQRNISERTLKTAKKELGILSVRERDKWYSVLPPKGKSAK